jgi:sec-independent protein translocase protein TatC
VSVARDGDEPLADTDEGKMSFLEHLGELRTRIIWSLVPAGVGLIVSLYFTNHIIRFLARPLTQLNAELVFTSPTEAFWTYMKVAMVAGIFVAMPFILWQVWAFVAPGLHKHERRYAGPFVIFGSLMFIGGGAFALLVVVPFAISFLVKFGQEQGLKPLITISNHIDFVLKFTLAFGLVFEMPLVLTVLSMIGIVTPQFLSKNRKYAILVNFIIAAILTPTPDMVNQTLMAGPLCILYEVGIVMARIFGKRARKPKDPAEVASAPPDVS